MSSQLTARLLVLPRRAKQVITITMDVCLCMVVVWLAFGLRIGYWGSFGPAQWWTAAWTIGMAMPLFYFSGLYRVLLRHDGGAVLARASLIFGGIFAALFTVIGASIMPRTLGVLVPVLLFLATSGARAAARHWLASAATRSHACANQAQVLIYGAGDAGRQLAALLASSREMVVRGFVDDAPSLQRATIRGLRIYSSDDLGRVVRAQGITEILLAIPSASHARRAEIVRGIQSLGLPLHVRSLPDLHDIARGRVKVDHLRDLDIEDLLGRDPVVPDENLLRSKITGKVVLVTGAGGSIGSELCRQIAKLAPSALVLLDVSEFALYAIHHELEASTQGLPLKLVPLFASVRDREHISRILATWKPDTIYHAAAYKHVPLVEHNPAEGIRNNTFGTMNMALLAREHQVSDFVLISTDKAVRPTNVMGASKRLAEMVLQALAAEGGPTRFSMVRFGNVLGSSGSVVPLFRRQIRAGGPITVTHPEITRYFMTIPEAAQLVIQASAMAEGGEVFLLDMGEPVKVIDLARKMVELSGMMIRDAANPDGDIELAVTGLRPGEKLYEELLIKNNPIATSHPRVMKGHESFPAWHVLRMQLELLACDGISRDAQSIRSALRLLVPGYAPPEAEVSGRWSYDHAREAVRSFALTEQDHQGTNS
ncbi:nucleoside-diphosphate sugar epimerase/dehydratase [Ramlibacter sp. AN1015]|uniref:nucleoside-diphosphate sugar epimerase/dehydratase n=1 Tax=Ramlibacter sp. AN1015 TaxID=3133428 RepID=UPI0030C5C399